MDELTNPDLDRLDQRALQITAVVHGEGSVADIAQLTRDLDRRDLIAVVISLAALVDIDRTPPEILDWMDRAAPRIAGRAA